MIGRSSFPSSRMANGPKNPVKSVRVSRSLVTNQDWLFLHTTQSGGLEDSELNVFVQWRNQPPPITGEIEMLKYLWFFFLSNSSMSSHCRKITWKSAAAALPLYRIMAVKGRWERITAVLVLCYRRKVVQDRKVEEKNERKCCLKLFNISTYYYKLMKVTC